MLSGSQLAAAPLFAPTEQLRFAGGEMVLIAICRPRRCGLSLTATRQTVCSQRGWPGSGLPPEQKIRAIVKVIGGPIYTVKEIERLHYGTEAGVTPAAVRNWALIVERLSPVPHQDSEGAKQPCAGC
jgi:hypothetical protein